MIIPLLLVLVTILTVLPASAWPTTVLVPASTAYNPKNATCLDGTPPAYAYSPGSPLSNVYIIHLIGGAWCFTSEECAERARTLLGSSLNWAYAANSLYSGLLANEHGSHSIMLHYCDGSSFLGNNGNIQGRAIVDALFAHIVANVAGVNHTNASIVLSGASAGGMGALFNFEHIKKTYFTNHTDVSLLLDSALIRDRPLVANSSVYYMRSEMQLALDYWNVTAYLNRDCVDANGYANRWRCLFTEYLLPYVAVNRKFILQPEYDKATLQLVMGIPIPTDYIYTENPFIFDVNTNQQIDEQRHETMSLLTSYTRPGDGLYASGYVYHGGVAADIWNNRDRPLILGFTPSDAFWMWLQADDTSPFYDKLQWMDVTNSEHQSINKSTKTSGVMIALIVTVAVMGTALFILAVLFIIFKCHPSHDRLKPAFV